MAFEVAGLVEIELLLLDYTQDLEIETHNGASAVELYDSAARIERLAIAVKTLAGRRVDETNAWRESGARNASDFLANRAGVSSSVVGKDLLLAKRLEALPNAQAAFTQGRVDKGELAKFAQKADAEADAEFAKVLASGPSAAELQDRLSQINKPKTTEKDLKDKEEKAASKRYAKFAIDPDDPSMFVGNISGPVEDLAKFTTRLKPLHDARFKAAKSDKTKERYAALEYDAFFDLIETGGSNKPAKSKDKGVIRVAENGRCEVVGIGEVSTLVALKYASDKHFKVLDDSPPRNGKRPRDVSVSLVTYLMARDPTCKVPGCSATVGLENEHRLPVVEGGQDSPENCWRVCSHHHHMKTYEGWCLIGDLVAGNVEWVKRREKGDGGSGYSLEEDLKQQEETKKPEAG